MNPASLSWASMTPPSARASSASQLSPWRAHVPSQPTPSPIKGSDQNHPDVGGGAGGGEGGGGEGGGGEGKGGGGEGGRCTQ